MATLRYVVEEEAAMDFLDENPPPLDAIAARLAFRPHSGNTFTKTIPVENPDEYLDWKIYLSLSHDDRNSVLVAVRPQLVADYRITVPLTDLAAFVQAVEGALKTKDTAAGDDFLIDQGFEG